MTIGDLLNSIEGVDRTLQLRPLPLDAVAAARRTLRALLQRTEFTVRAGRDGVGRKFVLKNVADEWPNEEQPDGGNCDEGDCEESPALDVPCAAVTVATVNEYSDPYDALEDTRDVFGLATVLWQTGELSIRFQVDFWTAYKPERDAIAGAMELLFRQNEFNGVVMEGPEEYFRQPVRFTLKELERYDNQESVQTRERRLRMCVLADICQVQLRSSVDLQPSISADGGDVT